MKLQNVENTRPNGKSGYYPRTEIMKKINEISNQYIPPKLSGQTPFPILEISWYYRRVICYICSKIVDLSGEEYWQQFDDYWYRGEIKEYIWCYTCAQIIHSHHVTALPAEIAQYHLDECKRIHKPKTGGKVKGGKKKPTEQTFYYFRCCPCRYNLESRQLKIEYNPMNFKKIPSALIHKFRLI